MPDVNQYSFTNKELLTCLIKNADVHEGKWVLDLNFTFSAGNYGPTPAEASPGIIVLVSKVGIQRAGADTPPEMVLDAAEVNPKT